MYILNENFVNLEKSQIIHINKSKAKKHSKITKKLLIESLLLLSISIILILILSYLLFYNLKLHKLQIYNNNKQLYRYSIGIKPLVKGSSSKLTHASFLLNNDTFEYLETYSGESFETFDEVDPANIVHGGMNRHRNRGQDPNFNWDILGKKYSGETYLTPSELERLIRINGTWTGYEYNFLYHNCHDFVQFCLEKVGFNKSMISRDGPIIV